MRTLLRRYARAIIAVFALALILSALPATARAAGPSVTITGSGVGTCAGRPAPSLAQGETFDVNLADFPIPTGAGVGILLTLPDGRMLDPTVALPDVPPAGFYNLLQQPDFKPGPLISASFTYASAATWPVGCYTVTATQRSSKVAASPSPFLTASAQFRLLPRQFSAQPGNLRLWAQTVGTSQPTGVQPMPTTPITPMAPLNVNIFGQGVPVGVGAALTIQIVQPNGAIIVGPPPTVYADGSFNLPAGYAFTNLHQPGMHTVLATVTLPNPLNPLMPTIYTAQAQFNLTAAPVVPTNNATLEMLAPFNALVPRGTPISIQGRKFISAPPAPGAPNLDLALVLPNGVRLGGGAAVDASGNVAIGPFPLGNGYPTGAYRIIATQAAVGAAPARTATLTWRLIP